MQRVLSISHADAVLKRGVENVGERMVTRPVFLGCVAFSYASSTWRDKECDSLKRITYTGI